MSQDLRTMLKGALCAAGIAACLLVPGPAAAQIVVEVHPPAAFIATSSPVYHEGHATYWYGNRWYYREGPAWRYYHEEPVYLREHRVRFVPFRRHYERHEERREGHRR